MDQFTFVQLADQCIEIIEIASNENMSVEESLLIFLDIVGQESSFKSAAETWDHDEELIRKYAFLPSVCIAKQQILTVSRIFEEILGALRVLKEQDEILPSCPKFSSTKSKWRVLETWHPFRMTEGYVQVGEDREGDVEVKQEEMIEVLTALNNFIHEHKE